MMAVGGIVLQAASFAYGALTLACALFAAVTDAAFWRKESQQESEHAKKGELLLTWIVFVFHYPTAAVTSISECSPLTFTKRATNSGHLPNRLRHIHMVS